MPDFREHGSYPQEPQSGAIDGLFALAAKFMGTKIDLHEKAGITRDNLNVILEEAREAAGRICQETRSRVKVCGEDLVDGLVDKYHGTLAKSVQLQTVADQVGKILPLPTPGFYSRKMLRDLERNPEK